MSHNEDDLIKELKDLKSNAKINDTQKDKMKMALQKHAQKKKARSKAKHTFIWFTSAAAVLLCGILVYSMINQHQLTLPADEHPTEESQPGENDTQDSDDVTILDEEQNSEEDDADSGEEDVSPEEFKVDQVGTEEATIMNEGMQEEITLQKYRMDPYGITYSMPELLDKYAIEGKSVRHHDDKEYISISLHVVENNTIENISDNLNTEYREQYNDVDDVTETTDENPYEGLHQGGHNASSNEIFGYYVYQINNNVLVIEYEYIGDAGDGISARKPIFLDSIQ
ncbi:hypothetical protein MUN88_11035 [Gracilibacillus caseinilyticus]|uniref:DUF4367 domain-containing protein n=1 Tax=Gracilibacillus caseinilyticus TaxID=2932256 RepID=A0ABY4EQZ1_9BACI|nr:hypothetical protein [Gracilibacillus caseinilyticus]UOQ46639.1 hypothetical protein MUN88_11035 [Gracilibacillus caseinilyticus]